MSDQLTTFISNRRSTLKLAATYLMVIMIMSIVYSLILYFTSVHTFDRHPNPPPPDVIRQDPDHEIDEWLGRRDADNRSELAIRLIILNIATLFVGTCLSYFLARKTLQPIEKAMKEQERFIADASHELRTPLTSILLSNEVALRNKGLTLEDSRGLIGRNVDDMNELKSLSDELLDVSVARATTHMSRQAPGPIIDGALKKVRPLAKTKYIRISMQEEAPDSILTDKQALMKILVILLDNAIKYSSKHTTVTISFGIANRQPTIIVADQGQGIAATDIEHIFERFYRVDSSRSQSNGHGLGLSIAARLATELRAELSVVSTPGKGSTFTIKLPQ